jgi:hypothetical protein
MIKKYLAKCLIVISLYSAFGFITTQQLQAQVLNGSQIVKWLWVSSLRQYFSNAGVEIEYGRRGRAYLNTDQDDGLRWPAQYPSTDHNVGKGLWIGTTNFTDPTNGVTYPYKVIPLGRSALYINSASYPVDFKMIGRFSAPTVVVDGNKASDLDQSDLSQPTLATDLNAAIGAPANKDQIVQNLPVDRMIYNTLNIPIGITITRKILASTQQYHDNYYIYEYVFKNTGLIDNLGGKISPVKTLTGVVFDFTYRFADNNEGYENQWGWPHISYGINTINDEVGQDATHTLPAPNDFCANFAYYGPHSASTGVSDDIGAPDFIDGHILGGIGFTGEMVLHADTSPQDTTNDPTQPRTIGILGSDGTIQNINLSSPFNPIVMQQQYQSMTTGREVKTHAEQIGKDANGWPSGFADTWGGNAGGYGNQQGFGPYTLAPGDSIRIVLAEAVAGINREKNVELAKNWYPWYQNGKTGTASLVLPSADPTLPAGIWNSWNGGTTTDGNIYKNAWVFTGRDSLFQTFRRARANYNSHYNIPQPPPPPNQFTVTSGGDRISLQWSKSAESWPTFNGYRLYRAETTTAKQFELIFSCDKSNVANSFDDKSAKRGFNYFYYIQTKDDGSTNDIEPGVPLVSSMYYTMTNTSASLQRPATNSLSNIRVVPNPYNIRATSLQFGSDQTVANRLAFFGLPKYCVIKIFTETGDLIQTINHTNGSGDETWNSMTSSKQVVVSGLYIAYFEVTQDISDDVSGKVILRKGDNIFRKFIIIR